MLDPRRLQVLRSVVAAGSIQGAATALGYTPSAISQQISALQRETGLTLLERSGRGVVPTAAGTSLAARSEAALAALATLGEDVADLRANRTAQIRIEAFSSAGAHWLPDIVAELRATFPQTKIAVTMTEWVTGVGDSRADLVIAVGADESRTPGYRYRPLLSEEFVLVVPAQHHLAGRAVVDLAELADEQFIDADVHHGPCWRLIQAAFTAAGVTPQFSVEASDYPYAVAFVARGAGITVIPRLAAHQLPDGTTSLRLANPTPTRRIGLLVKESAADHPAVRYVIDALDRQIHALATTGRDTGMATTGRDNALAATGRSKG